MMMPPRKNFRFEFETSGFAVLRIFSFVFTLLMPVIAYVIARLLLSGILRTIFSAAGIIGGIISLIILLLDRRGKAKKLPPVIMDGINARLEPNESLKALIPFATESTYNALPIKPYGITIRKDVNNALLLTNRALYSIYIPMEGAGLIIGGRDVADQQVYLRSKELRSEGQRLEKLPLSGIFTNVAVIRKHPLPINNITWTDRIVTFKFSTGDKTYKYAVADQNEYQRLKALLTA